MRKHFFLLAIFLISATYNAMAQTEKGKNQVGGTLSYSSSNSSLTGQITNGKSKALEVSPSYGHFFAYNLVFGLSVSYSRQKQSNSLNGIYIGSVYYPSAPYGSEQTLNYFLAGPYIRYYTKIAENFKFFAQFNAYAGFGNSKFVEEYPNTTQSSKNKCFGGALTPGFAFFPAKKWAIEFGFNLISYSKNKTENSMGLYTDQTAENLNLGFNSFSPLIGINYHF